MVKILSLQIAIPSILILTFGGLGIMEMAGVCNIWAYLIWGVGFIWFIGLLWYRGQRVFIINLSCIYDASLESKQGQVYVTVEGFIKSWHKDGLKDIQLILFEDSLSPRFAPSQIPDSIASYPKKFKATYLVQFSMLEKGRVGQPNGEAVDGGELCVVLSESKWITKPFKIGHGEAGMPKKIKLNKKRNNECISKDEFHKILC